jgi:hypothetical protein
MKEIEKISSGCLYVHIYADGRIFILPADFEQGFIGTIKSLELEVDRTKELGGIVYYSLEETASQEKEDFTKACDLLFENALETQMMHPHPQAYGYYKSVVPYLNDAVEVAASDVKGLLSSIEVLEQKIAFLTAGSRSFQVALEELQVLKDRYYIAQQSLDKLSAIHYHLCVRNELEES